MSPAPPSGAPLRLPPHEIPAVIATAHALAEAARRETLGHFRQADLVAEDKSDGGTAPGAVPGPARFDPVTAADHASEAAMRAILAERRPDDGILGEEGEDRPGTSGLTWVLDPIDGTRAFISGTPTWGVLIALCDAEGPVYGIIDQPYIGERFEGGLGRARLTGPRGARRLETAPAASLSEAKLFTTFPEVGTEAERRAFEAVRDAVRLTRYGLDCYAYGLIAAGQIDLVIEAAGGVVTDWTGGPAHRGGRVLAASGPEIHARALEVLRAVPE
jgi:histidinol phosphatase-like enzyme (inositol monophosphatase family)